MKMGMCMCAVRLGGLPTQCPGMAKGLATPLCGPDGPTKMRTDATEWSKFQLVKHVLFLYAVDFVVL